MNQDQRTHLALSYSMKGSKKYVTTGKGIINFMQIKAIFLEFTQIRYQIEI